MKRTTTSKLAIDLFSGCGGLSFGLFQAGFNVVAASEIRPEARATYLLNHKTYFFDDVRKIGIEDEIPLSLANVEIDLLAACPPCQGFSSIRTRNQNVAKDPRNELIFEVIRLARLFNPKCILIENVPRLFNDIRLQQVILQAKRLGYKYSKGIVDAQDYGVPQRRKRMILILSRVGVIDIAPPSGKRLTVRDAIGKLPPADGDHKIRLHHLRQRLSPLVMKRITHIKHNRSELPDYLVLKCHKRYNGGFRDVYGRMDWDKVSPTITRASHNPSKGRFVHPEQNRGLTLYEALLLQGFPKNYKFPKDIGIGKIASMIGEAVPPPLAKAQAEHILKKLKEFEQTKRRKH